MKFVKFSLLIATSAILVSSRDNILSKLNSDSSKHLEVGMPKFWNGCSYSVNRMKKEPVDYQAIIAKGDKWTDKSFERSE